VDVGEGKNRTVVSGLTVILLESVCDLSCTGGYKTMISRKDKNRKHPIILVLSEKLK
jgi:hypothetical protein